MYQDSIERLLKTSRHLCYVDFLLFACEITAIIVTIFSLKRIKYSYLFLLYCCSAFLLILYGKLTFFIYSRSESTVFVTETSNIIFAMIEYFVFYTFFRQIFARRLIRQGMDLFGISLLVATAMYFYKSFRGGISEEAIYEFSDFIISSELFFLGILCLIYYFGLFQRKPSSNLSESPSFWITTGLFFYALMITPFFLILTDTFRIKHEQIYYSLFILHYLSFSFLFIAIAKAFQCRKPLTT